MDVPLLAAGIVHDEIDNIQTNDELSYVIIYAGTNNLPSESVDSCVRKIQKLALKTRRKFQNAKIGISSIIHRDDINVSANLSAVNGKLKEMANNDDFVFIDNSRIDGTCLNGSKLHLNAKGSAYLANTSAGTTTNPANNPTNDNSTIQETSPLDVRNDNSGNVCRGPTLGEFDSALHCVARLKGLKIASITINSLLKHIEEIRHLLFKFPFDIFANNESKIDDSVMDGEISIPVVVYGHLVRFS